MNKLETPSPLNTLCKVWLKLAQWFWGRFLNFVNVFSLFYNYLCLKKWWPFIWINLSSLHQRILCAKFGWNWPSRSGEGDFLILSKYLCYFSLEKGRALHLNKLNTPLPKDALRKVWLKLAQRFWKRRFLDFVNVFRYFAMVSPW